MSTACFKDLTRWKVRTEYSIHCNFKKTFTQIINVLFPTHRWADGWPILATFPSSVTSPQLSVCIPLSICAHKPMHRTPMYTQQNPDKVTTISNSPVKWSPQFCSAPFSSAVPIWKQSFTSPFIPSNHVTLLYEAASPAAPMTAQTQPTIHTQQTPRTNTGLVSTEPMLELRILQQLLCRWIHLPMRGYCRTWAKWCVLSINLSYISNILIAVPCKCYYMNPAH